MPLGCPERAHHVESPQKKGPCDGDGLEHGSWHAWLTGVPLTTITGANEPEETMVDGLGDECPQ